MKPDKVYLKSSRAKLRAEMSFQKLRMGEEDYKLLAELEEAFERKDLAHFISFLQKSKGLPLLLRVHAVCMLEHIGDEGVVDVLSTVLKEDPSPLTRHEAAFTLGQLGYRSAVNSLIEAMLTDESPIVRHESAVALSSIGDESALVYVEKALEDKDEDVRNSALMTYEYLTYVRRKREAGKISVRPKIRL